MHACMYAGMDRRHASDGDGETTKKAETEMRAQRHTTSEEARPDACTQARRRAGAQRVCMHVCRAGHGTHTEAAPSEHRSVQAALTVALPSYS